MRRLTKILVVSLLSLSVLLIACQPTITTVVVTVAPATTPRLVTATPSPTDTPVPTPTPKPLVKRHKGVNALLIMPDLYGANYYLNRDQLEQFGWNITLAGIEETAGPCRSFAAQHGCRAVAVDVLISDITDVTEYDVVAIQPSTRYVSSGSPFGDLLDSQAALDLIASAVEEGLAVYATCSGVCVLAAADVIDGRNVTGSSGCKSECLQAGANFIAQMPPPVIDENIVTTVRGLYYHVQNNEALATALAGLPIEYAIEEKAEIASSSVISVDGALWTRTFGGSNSEGGRSIAETSDGGFIIAGYTHSFGAGNADIYLIKTDADGHGMWSKAYGGPGWEYGYSVAQTDDGGYIVTGYTTSYGAGSKDVYLVKLGADGSEMWSKTFGGASVDVGRSVQETSDGGYIIAGYTESFDVEIHDVYLIKTDAQGSEIWSKTFGDFGPEMGRSVWETSDGGYVVAGATGSYTDNSDVYLLKVDPGGNEIWTRTFNEHIYDWGNAVRETSDGGYIVAGNTDEEEIMGVYLLRTDSEGNEIWARTFGEPFYDYGDSVCETSDGGYIISGATKSAMTGKNDVYLVRVDSEGNRVWTTTFGDAGSEWGSSVLETKDGDYVVVGHTDSYGAGSFDVWVIRVDGEGIGVE